MTAGRSDLVEVEAEFCMTKGGGIAIWDGRRDKYSRQEWTWLPKSLVEDNEDGTFSMPEWLAIEKGLI